MSEFPELSDLTNFSNLGKPTGRSGLIFRHEDGGEMMVEVFDKYPSLGDTHIEGRRVVEVSVELFVELMAQQGYGVVIPEEGK